MDSKPTIPNVEVIENGKPISQERIDPAVIQFLMQAATTAQLVKLRKLEESKIPIGAPSYEWTVTDSIKEIKLDRPWIAFALINGGTGNIRVRINDPGGDIVSETTVDSGETLNRDFKYPIVYKISLVTEVAGTTATVRVWAEEGRKCQ